jgi:xylose isomerase
VEDIFHAHIGGADTFARALLVAEKILTDSPYPDLRKERYASFDSGQGKAFEKGSLSLEEISKIGLENTAPKRISGKQEMFENIINQYL